MSVELGTHVDCGGKVSTCVPMGIGRQYNHCSKCHKEVPHSEILTDCKTCHGYGGVPTHGGYDTDQCPDCNGLRWLEIP